MKSQLIQISTKTLAINRLNPNKMKKFNFILIALIGVLGFFSSCEKDGNELIMKENVVAPSITSLPNLELMRVNGDNNLTFTCSPVDAGFNASATYFLEAAPAGTNFEKVISIYNGFTCDNIEISVADLNALLLNEFPADETSSADFRIRCVLESDAGLGVDDFVYTSETSTADVTIFGLLRLDVIITGASGTQKIVSAASDGNYAGLVKFEIGDTFTLLDPDNNITYGTGGSGLVVDGPAIAIADTDAGWNQLMVNTNDLTYTLENYFIGLVGSATPNGWDAPDQKMDYDSSTKTWSITLDLVDGVVKFRRNDGWSWNMGFVEGETPGYTGALQQGGVGNDIPLPDGAGNYTVILTILSDDAGTYEFIKN